MGCRRRRAERTASTRRAPLCAPGCWSPHRRASHRPAFSSAAGRRRRTECDFGDCSTAGCNAPVASLWRGRVGEHLVFVCVYFMCVAAGERVVVVLSIVCMFQLLFAGAHSQHSLIHKHTHRRTHARNTLAHTRRVSGRVAVR